MKNLFIIVAIVWLGGCHEDTQTKIGLEGRKLPSFTFLLTDSITKLNTDAINEGKPFAFLYFSPDCPFCRAQIKDIVEHREKLKNIRFYFLSNYSYKEIKLIEKEFSLEKFENITTALDSKSDFQKYFYIPTVPYLAIYDSKKRLKQVLIGVTDFKKLESEINNKSL